MKRVFRLIFSVLAFGVVSFSASAETTPDDIIKLEREWAEAMKNQDLERLYPMMHQDFRLMAENASAEVRKGEWLLNTMHAMTFDKVEIIDPKATVFGDTAVVSMRMDLDWTSRGQPLPGAYRLVDTWVKTGDGWQVISRISHGASE